MDPNFPKINSQVRSILRWYDSEDKKTIHHPQCREELTDCPYYILSPNDALLPFQFPRPNSVLGITSWKVYDSDGNEVYDLADDIDQITITRFTTYDYLTYNGDTLSLVLDEGVYHSRIVTNGVTYYSEDFQVPCQSFGDNVFDVPPFDGGLQSESNPDAVWLLTSWARVVYAVKNTAGAPTDPLLENEGYQVINTNENNLYTYTGGVWVASTPSTSTGWYDYDTGNWYRFNAGAWQGLVNDPITVDSDGICFDGVTFPFTGPTIAADISLYSCVEVDMQVEFTVSGMTQGSLGISMQDYGGMTVTADGTYTFSSYVGNGYTLNFTPSSGFDGCITNVEVRCPNAMETCYMKLSWTNCGNVGNTYYGTGLTQAFYFPHNTPLPVPQPTENIDTEEQDDGSLKQVFARKGITWTLHAGMVPWYVADALTDVSLHDTVKLNVPFETGVGSFNAATLTNVRVITERDPDVSDCLVKVTINFEVDNTAVACCDDFTRPCLEACVDAFGFDDETPLTNDQYYVFRNQPRYAYYTSDAFQPYDVCNSGLANIVDELGAIQYTTYWDPNDSAWHDIATNTVFDVNAGDPCTLDLRWTVWQGYRAILQFTTDPEIDAFADVTDEDFDMSDEEWAANSAVWTVQASRGFVRLRVYVDDCTIGYSRIEEFDCG